MKLPKYYKSSPLVNFFGTTTDVCLKTVNYFEEIRMWLAAAYRRKPIPRKKELYIHVESTGKYHSRLSDGTITFCLDSHYLTKVLKNLRIPISYKGGNLELNDFCPVYDNLAFVQKKVLGYGEIVYCRENNWLYVGDGYSYGGNPVREN